jgi:pyridoxal phosphate-dependent aminotransferase EpsN
MSPPHVGEAERALLLDAFDSNWIAPLGPHVDAFERELAARVQMPYAAALSSGTGALHLALSLLGVGRGHRVLAPTLTVVATVNPIRYLGAEPVLIDCEPRTWGMDPALVDEELTRLARAGAPAAAVVSVDLLGQCADYEALEPVCRRHGVPLVEDAAEALGASFLGRPAGAFGDAAFFSFNGNKIITTSGGGMLVSRDADFIAHARKLATQARDPAPHYQHSEMGYNYRMSNLLAALGRGQLQGLDAKVAARRAHFAAYVAALGDLPGWAWMPDDPRGVSTRWLTCALVDAQAFGVSRQALMAHLEAHQIESRPLWKPMHLQPLFADCRVVGGAVSEALFARGLCLPSGSSLTPADRQRVIDRIRSAPAELAR